MSLGLSRRALLRGLVPARPEAADTARLAQFADACVEPKGVACRRCGEVCDENAIRFAPLPGGRAMPLLDAVKCSGCGECLAPCPVSAITLIARDTALLARAAAQLEVRP